MIQFDIKNLVPHFILEDRDGWAMAKAIEAGMKHFLKVAQTAVDTWGNPDAMPEWRLDEMAWEYNIPYDYTADVEIKREWIRNVFALSKLYGTPDGIVQYMGAYYEDAQLQENWAYNGNPYHFRMVFPDSWTPEKVAWATKTINEVKNVRSVLDSFYFKAKWLSDLFVGCALYTYEAGTYSVPAVTMTGDWYIDELGNMLLDEIGILLIVEG